MALSNLLEDPNILQALAQMGSGFSQGQGVGQVTGQAAGNIITNRAFQQAAQAQQGQQQDRMGALLRALQGENGDALVGAPDDLNTANQITIDNNGIKVDYPNQSAKDRMPTYPSEERSLESYAGSPYEEVLGASQPPMDLRGLGPEHIQALLAGDDQFASKTLVNVLIQQKRDELMRQRELEDQAREEKLSAIAAQAARAKEERTFARTKEIEKMKQQGRYGLEAFKQKGALDVAKFGQMGREGLEMLRQSGDMELEKLRQKGKGELVELQQGLAEVYRNSKTPEEREMAHVEMKKVEAATELTKAQTEATKAKTKFYEEGGLSVSDTLALKNYEISKERLNLTKKQQQEADLDYIMDPNNSLEAAEALAAQKNVEDEGTIFYEIVPEKKPWYWMNTPGNVRPYLLPKSSKTGKQMTIKQLNATAKANGMKPEELLKKMGVIPNEQE